jgi:cytochrome b subunit of formate dehydrogenase
MVEKAWKVLTVFLAAWLWLPGLAMATIQADAAAAPPALDNQRCLRCHADPTDKIAVRRDGSRNNIFIDHTVLDRSVHGKVACVGCHSDVTKLPHKKPLVVSIGCTSCHKERYTQATAGQDPTKQERLAVVMQETGNYLYSVHARPSAQNQAKANAACHDCHEGHNIGAPGSVQRAEHRLKNPEVCGRCHEKQKNEYLQSVHGQAVVGKKDAKSAVCSDCHTPHSIEAAKLTPMQLTITRNCGSCHEKALHDYLESYHGQVNRLGYANTAKCQDCHSGHGVLKVSDPKSSVHPDNRLKNCRKCHEDANANFLRFRPHADADDPVKHPDLYVAKRFMQALIIGVMAFFWVHTLLWLFRELSDRIKGKGFHEDLDKPDVVYFQRFKPVWRWIHGLFAIATMTLILTGTSLLFSHTEWAKWVVYLLGGPTMEGIIHRTAAVTWLGIFVVHLILVARNIYRARDTFEWFGGMSLLPSWNDAKDLRNMFRWFFGLAERPDFCHWTYWQKFDYWAPFWGAMVIGLSGIILFSPEVTARYLPGVVFNFATLVHAEEALLAAVFLNTVHFFNVHFRPERFPMSTTIFTGAIPFEEFKHDHHLEYEKLEATGELSKYLVKRPSRRADLAASFIATVLIMAGLTLLTLVLIGVTSSH